VDILDVFALLDDSDIWGSMKFWLNHEDFVLATLSNMLLNRKIFRIEMSNSAFSKDLIRKVREEVAQHYGISEKEAQSLVGSGKISNEAYISSGQKINILSKNGEIVDIAKTTELPNIKAMSKIITKYYICWPKGVETKYQF
ncbi:MAG: phosphohydrolase, partial [Cyclobacteriaceae bacterium]|nr:phosphohydrolase [Cyclobacteriaceae bacterium]